MANGISDVMRGYYGSKIICPKKWVSGVLPYQLAVGVLGSVFWARDEFWRRAAMDLTFEIIWLTNQGGLDLFASRGS